MLLYEDELLRVSQGFFTSFRVLNKLTGAKVVPEYALQAQVGLVWPKIAKSDYPKPFRRAAEGVMFQVFGLASINPNGLIASEFKTMSADDLAEMFILETGTRLGISSMRQR